MEESTKEGRTRDKGTMKGGHTEEKVSREKGTLKGRLVEERAGDTAGMLELEHTERRAHKGGEHQREDTGKEGHVEERDIDVHFLYSLLFCCWDKIP